MRRKSQGSAAKQLVSDVKHMVSAANQVDRLADSLDCLAAPPSRAVQHMRRARASRVSPDVLADLIALSERNGGVLAGIRFDPAAARALLARAEHAERLERSSLRLARRAKADAIRSRALLATHAMAAIAFLKRAVRTPEGEPFIDGYAQIAHAMRRPKRRR